jgi:hypothetical protein
MLNSNIRADAVEVLEYPDLVEKYRVRGVPKTVINNTVEFFGALPEADLIERLLEAAHSGSEG